LIGMECDVGEHDLWQENGLIFSILRVCIKMN
jgi:hypothetical protein